MTKGLNIVSRLTFENIPDGTLPTSIPDENQYSNYSYTKSGTVTVETIDGIKFIKLNSTTAKIYSPSIISDQSKKNFQAEFDVIFDTLKVDTHLVSIGVTTLANALRVVASNNPAQGLRLINGNNQISSYYRFENNKKYTICVGFKDNVISMYIDGTIIGYFYSEEFINSLNITTPSNIILGAALNNTNDVNVTLYGKLGNINISSGPSVKHEESYTKYGTNLVSFLNFENLAGIGTYKAGLEAVYEGINWRGVESATYSNGYGNIKNISTDLTGDFTVKFSLKKFKVANANILKYGNYSVDYVAGFIPVPEPDVEVNEYTTSALNFENGLVDQIGTTVWTKEGTANITSVNKIFGENSFETKALGDSLYTNSNVITGGSTPFTIEFYFLTNNFYTSISGAPTDVVIQYPLISQSNSAAFGEQAVYIHKDIKNIQYYRQSSFSNQIDRIGGKNKIRLNEINKLTISFDGSAIRYFLNDELDFVIGSIYGWMTADGQPIRFMDVLVPAWPGYRTYTSGLIDNINIHDGIATKVRDPDPYEEFLVVDLAFDGENNSTKIIDNCTKPYAHLMALYYPFNNSSYDGSATGTITIQNDTSIFGDSCAYFNSGYITHTSSEKFNLSSKDFTIKAWVKFDSSYSNSQLYPSIIAKRYSGTDWDWGIEANMNNKIINFVYNKQQYIGIGSITLDTWMHICVTCKNGVLRTFCNGVLVNTSNLTGTIAHSTANVLVGRTSTDWSDNYYKGHMKDLILINGYCEYVSSFDLPTSSEIFNRWSVNGNVKISTEQKFDGYSSLKNNRDGYLISNIQPITSSDISTISFEFYIESINNNNVYYDTYDGSYNNTFQLMNYGGKFVLWYSNITVQITTLENRSKNKITFIYNNRNVKVYVNGYLKLDTTLDIDLNFGNKFALFGQGVYPNSYYYSDGYFKNFKIYKGVAVIPEDPTGKIQLDFDNNFNDKYGNSTWTNNGVTFDQVNSVKGSAAYFNGVSGTMLDSGINNNFNFTDNFLISLDAIKTADNIYPCMLGSATTTWQSNNQNPNISFHNSNTTNFSFNVNNVDVNNGLYGQAFKNNWYNFNLRRISNTLQFMINDTIQGVYNINNTVSSFNFNEGGGTRIGSAGWTAGNSQNFTGLIDNFKSTNNYQGEVVIDKPAVHLPLETNAINTGFTHLTINSVGSPTYTTVDGKKCIKFESGKYLTINSNNIFNLGNSSDFYMEFELYITTLENRMFLISSMSLWTSPNDVCYIHVSTKGELIFYHTNNSTVIFSKKSNENVILVNQWQKIIFKRTNDICSISINNTNILDFTSLVDISNGGTSIGTTSNPADVNDYVRGYMSNFKMFVGTSEIPETYNDKKVLDLDFKPTGKSYLFKDNNNKCVIHPVNITQRDYQDSQYCCAFNGTDQYLQLGKNDLLNFGLDDFVIDVKFKLTAYDNWSFIICNGIVSGEGYYYLAVSPNNNSTFAKLFFNYNYSSNSYFQIRSINTIPLNEIINVKIIRNGQNVKMYINDEDVTDLSFNNTQISTINLNGGSDTKIGAGSSIYKGLIGYIYSIKVLRNTTDLSLLEDENTDVIIGDTTLTLSNGTDSQEVIFDNKDQNDFRFVHSNDSTKLIVNEQILEVQNVENELNELSLFTDFNAEAKDIKTYNIAFEDEDTFSGNVPIHTQLGEIEEISTLSDEFIVVDQGDFIVKGFFEGRSEDSRYQIQNRFDKFIVHTGNGPFNYNGLNERYIDDYEIYLPDTKETMPIPTEPMIRGYITVSITPTECEGINFGVKVFRRSDNKLIGIYNFNNYICTIDNLDCNKRYDCIIFDQDVNLESRCLSNRTPIPY